MPKKSLILILIPLLLISCLAVFAPPPTPTPTPTFTPTLTLTLTLTPSPTITPSPTLTLTATPPPNSVKNQDEFENMVNSGEIQCQGAKTGNVSTIKKLATEASDSGVMPKNTLLIVGGFPNRARPERCLFIMYSENGITYIVYKDSSTGEILRLQVLE